MCRTREENAEDLRLEAEQREPSIAGVCKDCGNGTLNNELNRAFVFNGDEGFAGEGVLACSQCGSTHLDTITAY